jgi:hypothetical protein
MFFILHYVGHRVHLGHKQGLFRLCLVLHCYLNLLCLAWVGWRVLLHFTILLRNGFSENTEMDHVYCNQTETELSFFKVPTFKVFLFYILYVLLDILYFSHCRL